MEKTPKPKYKVNRILSQNITIDNEDSKYSAEEYTSHPYQLN
jgi:hypothetical protein